MLASLIFAWMLMLGSGVLAQQDFYQKPGRCITQMRVKCSKSSAESSCIFHLDCPGSQLCCSTDGCLNACVDSVNGSDSGGHNFHANLTINRSINDDREDNSSVAAVEHSLIVHSVTGDYFVCQNGLRIGSRYRCNGIVNCPGKDHSDEIDCPCNSHQSLCANGVCLETSGLCHPASPDAPKCAIASLNCSSFACSEPDNFRCRNTQCVPTRAKCDGVFNCFDGSDEENCAGNVGNFVCDGGLLKSRLNVWCNGVTDCQDHSDEPTNCTCIPGQFQCGNGRCIPEYQLCDFTDNCLDGSDEANCSVACTNENNLFSCPGVDGRCLASSQLCDGTTDCPDASDEINCIASKGLRSLDSMNACNRKGHFSCGPPSADVCVPLTAWCDQVTDCENQSDEPANCSSTCPNNSFQCDGLRCLSTGSRCDGKADCLDRTDETDCPCRDDQLPLPNSACLDARLFCNGIRDAADGSDEEWCTCKDRLRRTDPKKLCDAVVDCPDASDEMSCGKCSVSQFYCIKSQQCVFRNQTCDGQSDCQHGEDEENCLGVVPDCRIAPSMAVQQEHAGCLAVNNRGEWIPVCAERWSSSLSDAICEIMGYDKSLITNLIAMEPGEMPLRSADPKVPRGVDGPQIVISASKSCPSRKKVYIECGALTCGQGTSSEFGQPRALTGADVTEGKYPWTAALYHDGKFLCAATIVDQNWILTAAHCVIGMERSHLVARLGMTLRASLTPNEQFIPIDRITPHPAYRSPHAANLLSATADLALLHLSVPAHWNSRVKRACLPPTSGDLPETLVVAGWEQTRGTKSFLTGETLKDISIAAVEWSKCQANPLVEGSVTGNGSFCGSFATTGSATCILDDGGAALEKNFLGRWSVLGVMNFAYGCHTANAVAGFTNVAIYSDWITGVITQTTDSNATKIHSDDCPGGVRCALGQCINPSQVCDGNLDCDFGTDELNCTAAINPADQTINCDFQSSSLCGYRQDQTDQLNWYRGHTLTGNSSVFPSKSPNSTIATYLYISNLMINTTVGGSGRLISPKLPSSSTSCCLSVTFSAHNGVLVVYDLADNNKIFPVRSEGGLPSSDWTVRQVDIPGGVSTFVLDGRLPDNGNGSAVVAVASVHLDDGPCSAPSVLVT
ncbi:putative Atrial natriuretic peptide-converting enzyme [Hypsibius exemplaris]|uniref:Atrial natriuretic peptide-converting enzyme n=1 Tax=Hypsibius exemplaris TaxID=2072580 RepID=A0A1W0WVQ1_HYPEX|nr:putative Atrial natriuretic peptide-converting enzyme [Hypsibius exemplaris]